MTQLSGFRTPLLFLKATQKKLIYIPPYTKADGTVVPGHQAYVHVADDHADHKVVSGQGTYTQKQAHAKHAHEPWFQALPAEHQAPVLMHIATGLQDAASAAAVVSTFKKKIVAGVKPTPGEWKAYAAAPEAKKAEVKAAAEAAGHGALLASNPEAVAPAPAAAPAPAEKPAPVADVHSSSHQATPAEAGEAAAAAEIISKEGDTKPGADGSTLVLKDGHWIKQGGDAPAAAKPAPAVAQILDKITGAKLDPANVNAGAVNPKLDAIAKHLAAGDVHALLHMGFGSNTYQMKAVKLVNEALAALGSSHKVFPSQKMGSHPGLNGGQAPAETPTVAPAPAAAPKVVAAAVTPDAPAAAVPGALTDAEIHGPSQPVAVSLKKMAEDLAKEGNLFGMLDFMDKMEATGNPNEAAYAKELHAKMAAKKYPNGAHAAAAPAPASAAYALSGGEIPAPDLGAVSETYAKHVQTLAAAGDIRSMESVIGIMSQTGMANTVSYAMDLLLKMKAKKFHSKAAAAVPAAPAPAAAAPAATKPVTVFGEKYINDDDGHNKFWSVGLHGNQMITHYGKIGTKGAKTVKTYASKKEALAEMTKIVSKKEKGGYYYDGSTNIDHEVPADGAAPAAAPAAPKAAAKPAGPAGLDASEIPKMPLVTASFQASLDMAVAFAKNGNMTGVLGVQEQMQAKPAPKCQAYLKKLVSALEAKQAGGVQSMKMGPSVDAGPKEGDTKQGVDGMLVLKNGHWVKVAPTITQTDLPAAPKLNMAVNKGMAAHANKLALAGDLQGLKILKNQGTNVAKLKTYYGALIAALEKKGVEVGMAPAGAVGTTVADLEAMDPPKRSPKVTGAKAKPTPANAAAGEPVSMAGWVKTAGQKGYNEGGFFKDPAGADWYCKFPAGGEAVVKNELLANKLAQLAGLSVPDLQLVNQGGKVGLASKIIPGAKENKAALLDGKAAGLLSSFATHAWLANWDAVGNNPSKGFDNILVDDKGVAHHIDQGGALNYGGAGGKKQTFTDKVIELKTMLDPNKNANTAAVFGKMGAADITASVAKVAAISDDEITDFCLKYGPGTLAERQKMAATLIARKADMVAQYPAAAKAPKAAKPKAADHSWVKLKPGEKVVEVGTKFGGSYAKIEVPAKGFSADGIPKPFTYDKSSSSFVNAANTADIKKVYDTALSSKDADAVKAVKFEQIVKGTGEKTGKMISIDDHPSTAYVKEYVNQVAAELEAQTKPTYRMEHRGGFTSSYSAAAAEIAGAVKAMDHAKFQGWKDKAADYLVLNKTAGAGIPAPEAGQFKDVDPHDKEIVAFKAASDAKYEQLSAGEKSACKAYTGSAYWNWNSAMRLGTVDSAEFKAGAPMRQAFSKAAVELPEGIVLHRGIGVGGDTYKSVIGAVIQDGSFQSCSYGKKAAFSGHQSQLKLHISKGVKGMMATTFSGFGSSEREIILHPNCRYVVMSVESVGGKNIVNVLVLPHEG